jgi:cation diffusion facilitator CzcD-associated flavoprotein CzcO
MKGVTVAIVGAGQAGLAASRELTREGIDHVVLERGRVGQTWRDRWDSFRLVMPNWSVHNSLNSVGVARLRSAAHRHLCRKHERIFPAVGRRSGPRSNSQTCG